MQHMDEPKPGEMGTMEYHRAYVETPQEKQERLRERQTDSWFRELNDGRVEIMCKAPGYRIRVTAPEEQAWRAVELFEAWTGMSVHSERRPRKAPPIIAGQMSMTELESGGNDGED